MDSTKNSSHREVVFVPRIFQNGKKMGSAFLIRQGVVERMLKQAQITAGDEP